MGPTACVEVPALPLQVLLLRRPEWRGRPVAVVDRDHPHGRVLWANRAARRQGVVPGMRYVGALALESGLRAGTVGPEEAARWQRRLIRALRTFSPGVEPWDARPGVFWLDASGLERLHPSKGRWAAEIRGRLAGLGLWSRVAVGFSRAGTLAGVRRGAGPLRIFPDPEAERAELLRTPLERLGASPALLEELAALGVRTAGHLAGFSEGELAERLGPEAAALHRFVRGEGPPLQTPSEEEPLRVSVRIEPPEADLHRLLFRVKGLLDTLVARAARDGRLVGELRIALCTEDGSRVCHALWTAAPTLDPLQILNLVHLRLSGAKAPGRVEELALRVGAVSPRPVQRSLLDRPRRDLHAALRALARVRAELGEGTVVRARLEDRHLPEARFAWEPLEALPRARPRNGGPRPLVRRILEKPVPVAGPEDAAPAGGWLPLGPGTGPVVEYHGPYVLSGGWWSREVHREYGFARLADGTLLWLFRDRVRQRWFLQGTVE